MAELLAQLARNRECQADRVLGDPIDRGYLERMKAQHAFALKCT
jgi:hypothetical protein